jgi:hypothetical protein
MARMSATGEGVTGRLPDGVTGEVPPSPVADFRDEGVPDPESPGTVHKGN